MFKDTKSHGIVFIQFLSALNLFFGGDVDLSKDTINELYKNLSLRTLSGEKQTEFDKISDLTTHINFKMEHSILVNMDDQDKPTKTSNENVEDTYQFLKKPSDEDNFEREIVKDILKDESYEHKETETSYVAPTVTDAATIEDQTNKEIDDILHLVAEFNKVDAAVTRQKKVNYYNKLFDDIQDEPDRRQEIDNIIKTEDVFTDEDIFSDTDTKDISNLIDEIKLNIDVSAILFEHVPIDTASNDPLAPEPRLDFLTFY